MAKISLKQSGVWRRIKLLVLLQAGETFRSLKTAKANKKKAAFGIFLKVLAAVAVTGAGDGGVGVSPPDVPPPAELPSDATVSVNAPSSAAASV